MASTSDGGVKGNAVSLDVSLSADGTRVAFQSSSTNLDPGDTDGIYDIYVKDLVTGDLMLASTSDSAVKGNGHSYAPSLSPDGTSVSFHSGATNLDPGDTTSGYDVYVKDLTTGNITLASTSDSGVKSNGASSFTSLSAGGTRVAFQSSGTNLDLGDTDPGYDIYVKNLATGNITVASTSDAGVKGNQNSHTPFISSDGSKVAFYSFATNLDSGDTDGVADIYVKNLGTGDIALASTSGAGVKGNGETSSPSLSAHGDVVAFSFTGTNLDPGDTDTVSDVYVKDLGTGDITLASTSTGGSVKGDRNSYSPSLSAGTAAVAFYTSSTNLDPGDTDVLNDVYVKGLSPLPADLTIRQTDSPDPVAVRTTLLYRIVVKNRGPNDATGVTVTDQLPAGVKYLSAHPSQGSCSQASGVVSCDLGPLAKAARATVSVKIRPRTQGMISNVVQVSANEPDPTPANNQATETTTVQ